MPRPTKPFYAQWLGKHISGLCHLPDGRWRIVATGERFREDDERLAVERFQRTIGRDDQAPKTVIVGEVVGHATGTKNVWNHEAMERATAAASAMWQRAGWEVGRTDAAGSTELIAGVPVPEDLLWRWMAKQLRDDPRRCALKTGILAIGALDLTGRPAAPLKLSAILATYNEHGTANWRTKGQVKSAFRRLQTLTKAQTVADLDSDTLIAFRMRINGELAPAWASQTYAKIKAAFGFGLKFGLDAEQLAPAIARLKTLYAPPTRDVAKPQPIARDDFEKLLGAADAEWRAILFLSLNMALYIEDICTLKWNDFDLVAGTYAGRRGKTKVVRVGWLWPETIAALQAIPRKGQSPLVFTSQTGLRFHASSKYDTFRSLRERAGVNVPFSSIRDGGYTAAAAACDEKTAKLFAAHKFSGLMDHYVMRRPDLVKPAAEAVWAAYFGPATK